MCCYTELRVGQKGCRLFNGCVQTNANSGSGESQEEGGGSFLHERKLFIYVTE